MKIMSVPVNMDLPKATRDIERVKSDVAEFGYGIVEDVLPAETVKEIRGILAAEIEKDEKAGRIKESYTDRDAKNRRLAVLVDRHKCFRDLAEHPLALEMAEFILGPTYLQESYLLHGFSANVTRPGSKEMGIHSDMDFTRPYYPFPAMARVIWFLDDFDEEVGATRVVPKSHLIERGPLKDGSVKYETVPALGPAGSILVYDARLYHGTGANISTDRERAGLIAGYIQPCLRPSANFPMTLDPEAMKDASETLRLLLGYGTVTIGFDQPWRYAREDVAALAIGEKRTLLDKRAEARPESVRSVS